MPQLRMRSTGSKYLSMKHTLLFIFCSSWVFGQSATNVRKSADNASMDYLIGSLYIQSGQSITINEGASITNLGTASLGTITSGTWQGTAVGLGYIAQGGATSGQAMVWSGSVWAPSSVQPLNSRLTAVAALADSAGVLTNNGSGTLSYTATSTGGNNTADSGKLVLFTSTGTISVSTSLTIANNGAGAGTLFLKTPTNGYNSRIRSGNHTTARIHETPDVDGTFITTGDTGSVTNTMLAGSIAISKLAATTSAQLLGVLTDEDGNGNILTTNGSAANLTGFPTLNQSTTGSAATLTTARTINGTAFDGSASITITAAAGTLTGSTLASGVTASSLTSLGTIATGVWQGTAIGDTYISSASTWNAKESALTFSTGLTRTTNTITVNTSQNITTLSGLTSNGFVVTSGGTGALSVDTTTYLTAVTSQMGFSLDGGGSAVTAGPVVGSWTAPTDGTITGWSISAEGTAPTCTIDVWKVADGTALPTVAGSIMGTKPALSIGNHIRSATLTGWTTSFSAGDIFMFNVDATTNGTAITFIIEYTH
jgi:hypothetical protein